MPRYCLLCKRLIEPMRRFGVGFWILAIVTFGFSLLFFWAWPKRCPLCNGNAWGVMPRRGPVH